MPISRMMLLPPPESWKEFEVMTKDALAKKWSNPNLQPNGREGQPQHGVDVYGIDHAGVFSGVQCKRYEDQITILMVKDEVAKAEKFSPSIKAFYMVTTTQPDSKLQEDVRKLSKERVELGGFPVEVFFWPDIFKEVIQDQELRRSYYPEFASYMEGAGVKGPTELSILDVAFHGTRVQYYVDLLFGEAGFIAQEDPNQIVTLTSILRACFSRLLSGSVAARAESELDLIETLSLKIVSGEENTSSWSKVYASSSYVQQQAINLGNHLIGRELTIFKVGRMLAAWDKDADYDHRLGERGRIGLLGSIRVLVRDDDRYAEIESEINQYDAIDTYEKLKTPSVIYNSVRHAIGEALEGQGQAENA